MLQNAYFVANFRFDTADNEPKKEWRVVADRDGDLQALMENVVHELVMGGTGALLHDGSEANLEICLYAFDGKARKI